MNLQASHEILLAGNSFEDCRKKVLRFFDRILLVKYEKITIDEERSLSSVDQDFWSRVDQGIAINKQVIHGLVEELKGEGLQTMDDLKDLQRGYLSSMFHTAIHLLDGFFGIDSFFYNLEEDSHGLSGNMSGIIERSSNIYWLISVKAGSDKDRFEQFDSLRSAGK